MDKQYKYILFDWDGCLVDSIALWISAVKSGFATHNLSLTSEEIVKHRLYNEWQRLKDMGITDFQKFRTAALTHYNKNLDSILLHEEVEEMLKILKKKNYKTAVVTSSIRDIFSFVLKKHNFAQYFDVSITHDDVRKQKPDPEPFEKAIKLLGGTKTESLVVGDSYADILGGKNVGITTVCYYPQRNELYYSPEFIAQMQADHVIKHINDLLKIIS